MKDVTRLAVDRVSKTFSLFVISTLLLEHSFMVKRCGWGGGIVVVVHVIIVSTPVQGFGIF